MLFGPSCPHLLSFALREFNISQAFWTLLLCVSYPIPLKVCALMSEHECKASVHMRGTRPVWQAASTQKMQSLRLAAAHSCLPHKACTSTNLTSPYTLPCLPLPQHAVWSQGATVASLLAYLPQMRANSLARCAASEQHFQRAARALTAAAGAALPGPLAAAVHDLPRRLGPSGAFYAVHLALLLSSYLATLCFLFRFELGHRRLFARQHRLAAEAAALLYRKRQLALSLPALLLLCAIGWIACCFAVLFCFRVAALLHWLALHFVHALMLGIM